MEDLFKNRFENFEPAPPKNMLNNILEKAAQGNAKTPPKSTLAKKLLYTTAAAVIAVVSFVALSQNDKTKNDNDTIITLKSDKQSETILENKQIASKENTKATTNNSISDAKNNASKTDMRETTSDFHIIADRITCTGSIFIKTDIDINGSWSSNTSGVSFEYSDSSQTTVYFNGEGKVIFTFELADQSQSDTFALTFYKPADIDYTMTPADCGEENGKVVFTSDDSENRIFNDFSGSYNITVTDENVTINNLPSGVLSLSFKDQFFCDYSKLFSIASNRIEGEIFYNNTIVNKATLFTTNITNSDVSYQWDFGDNGVSTEKEPTHTYKKEGTYNIKLIVKKAICIDTLKKSITITKATDDNSEDVDNNEDSDNNDNTNTSSVNKFIIPNVITPNGDGKNDIFRVSYPDNIKEFHGYILNKNGIIIYKWDDPKGSWDGSYKGEIVDSDTYYYIIKGTYTDGSSYEFKSFIELYK